MQNNDDLDKLAKAGNEKLAKIAEQKSKSKAGESDVEQRKLEITTHPLYKWTPSNAFIILFLLPILWSVFLFLAEVFQFNVYPGQSAETPIYDPKVDNWAYLYFGICLVFVVAYFILFKILLPKWAKQTWEQETTWFRELPFSFSTRRYFEKIINDLDDLEFHVNYKDAKNAPDKKYLEGVLESVFHGKVGLEESGGDDKHHIFYVNSSRMNYKKQGYYLRIGFHKLVDEVLIPLNKKFPFNKTGFDITDLKK